MTASTDAASRALSPERCDHGTKRAHGLSNDEASSTHCKKPRSGSVDNTLEPRDEEENWTAGMALRTVVKGRAEGESALYRSEVRQRTNEHATKPEARLGKAATEEGLENGDHAELVYEYGAEEVEGTGAHSWLVHELQDKVEKIQGRLEKEMEKVQDLTAKVKDQEREIRSLKN
ncbi:hypothetical protein K490DRAFT_55874 [Saccharata proteae CBS 121410]|uniref:Uncharacterized protein n=1 Tax=Saccharata proteae CBS 121410 TaxID=1314787 RepID=A0A9P4HYM1_9PEZI|nr:hypothetical protein K490DRAFT_55874 [Saccharata proteae CBS 121410]